MNRDVPRIIPTLIFRECQQTTTLADGRGIKHSVFIDDVQRLAESIKTADDLPGSSTRMMSWDVYHPLEDMYEYMDYLEGTLHDD